MNIVDRAALRFTGGVREIISYPTLGTSEFVIKSLSIWENALYGRMLRSKSDRIFSLGLEGLSRKLKVLKQDEQLKTLNNRRSRRRTQ